MTRWTVGIDEVGRGPLAGDVYVCLVCVQSMWYQRHKKFWHGLTDSKKMSKKNRDVWFRQAQSLQKVGHIEFVVMKKSAKQIDTQGIAVVIRMCIRDGLKKLQKDPEETLVLLDGALKAPVVYTHQKTIIKGDATEKIISLASVIAKVSRDAYMDRLSKKYPLYHWEYNKGYGTQAHRDAIKQYGFSPEHRNTFCTRLRER